MRGEKRERCNPILMFSSIRPNWFLKKKKDYCWYQMSTSRRSYWFFDTVQQEIFICVLLRPRTNRWGLTSAEWQIPTPLSPVLPLLLMGNTGQIDEGLYCHYALYLMITEGIWDHVAPNWEKFCKVSHIYSVYYIHRKVHINTCSKV